MRTRLRYLTMLLGSAGACAAIAAAPIAAAAPQCTNTAPNTTLCQSNGSAQLVTSPQPNNYYPYWGFPIIGLGGFGINW